MQMYIASAGNSDPHGIIRAELDPDSGAMRQIDAYDEITDCLYLALHPSLLVLYAVGGGEIVTFRMADDGGLSLINRQPSGGIEPCYVSLTNDGKFALVANYTGPDGTGTIALFPLRDDGGVEPASHIVPPATSRTGPHPTRQDAPHPHMIVPVPDSKLILVPDLGTDHVLAYERIFQPDRFDMALPPVVKIQAGSGPRHLAFHPTERVFYVLSELEPLVTVVEYTAMNDFKVLATYPTLPPGEATPENNLGADIHITPSGRHLYASNRGHDSLAIFAVSADGESLTYIGHESTRGSWPRGFTLDPAGQQLIVANQHTDDLHSFRIDPNTGHLSATGYRLAVSAPVCVKIDPRNR